MKRVVALVLSVLAFAAAAAEVSPIDQFRKLDRYGDGKLSAAEAKVRPELETAFESLDKNHDGFLTPDEFGVWGGLTKDGRTKPVDASTLPSGSGTAQHMPKE